MCTVQLEDYPGISISLVCKRIDEYRRCAWGGCQSTVTQHRTWARDHDGLILHNSYATVYRTAVPSLDIAHLQILSYSTSRPTTGTEYKRVLLSIIPLQSGEFLGVLKNLQSYSMQLVGGRYMLACQPRSAQTPPATTQIAICYTKRG